MTWALRKDNFIICIYISLMLFDVGHLVSPSWGHPGTKIRSKTQTAVKFLTTVILPYSNVAGPCCEREKLIKTKSNIEPG